MVDKAIEAVTKKHRIKRLCFLIIGAFIMGYCYNAFILPNHLVYGGLSGLSIVTLSIIFPSSFTNTESYNIRFLSSTNGFNISLAPSVNFLFSKLSPHKEINKRGRFSSLPKIIS